VEVTKEKYHLRTAHSELMGYWTAECGGLNQVVHLWYYDSLAHRASVRAALGADPAWTGEYLSQAGPLLQAQDNALLEPLNAALAAVTPVDQGIYELHTLRLHGTSSTWRPLAEAAAGQLAGGLGAQLAGAWKTVIGGLNTVVVLVRHQSQDGLVEGANAVQKGLDTLASVLHSCDSKMLLPVFPTPP